MVLKAHLRFYGKYLIPEIAVTVLMFACFSAMAALIPRLLCNADAKDSMVRPQYDGFLLPDSVRVDCWHSTL